MATYNGAKFIVEQLDSILSQLLPDDEIIIVDDCSMDETVDIIKGFFDSRIYLYQNIENRGHVYSYNKAISLSNNELIFMSDQDDIWFSNRVEKMKAALMANNNSFLVSTNMRFMNERGEELDNFNIDGVRSDRSLNNWKNILDIFIGKSNYYGCAMAFHGKLKEYILPIPEYVESHDLWIAIAANLLKKNLHLDDQTLIRRIHKNNASIIKRPLMIKFLARIYFMKSIVDIKKRLKSKKSKSLKEFQTVMPKNFSDDW